jgi:hypothetical protein
MEVLYVEGLASHDGPESCAGSRKAVGEALTGEDAGKALSREKLSIRGADAVETSGRRDGPARIGERRAGPARSETLRTRGSCLLGNREILWLAVVGCPPPRSVSERPHAMSR